MKSGIKTTEFWLTVVGTILIDAGAVPVPDKYKAITTALALVGYALSRGLAKLGTARAAVPVTPTAPVTGVTQVTPTGAGK